MLNLNNQLIFDETFNPAQNYNETDFPLMSNENDSLFLTQKSTGEEKNFINSKTKRAKDITNPKKTHTKFSYDNLKRESKHLVIENVIKFINRKIYEAYNGKIGEGLFKMELMKLNQEQKKNSKVEFNQKFLNMTLKEILSQNITKRIKFYNEDHNKQVINKLIEEKQDIFEKIFNLTFIDCLEHFIGNKKIEELNGLTLFSEIKEEILEKNKNDGESYYKNLEYFMKEYKEKINNAKPKKRKE